MQQAINIDKKSDEAKTFLLCLMDWLEKQKSSMKDNESITNELAAQAYIENHALKLFLWADGQDRAAVFNKNVVKAFYTAGMLFDVMDTFGEPSETLSQNKKYAKWKASYIHNCLKSGETPIPGPMGGEEGEDDFGAVGGSDQASSTQMGFVEPPNIGLPDPPTGFNPHSGIQFPGYNPPPSAAPTPTDMLPSVPESTSFVPYQPAPASTPPSNSTSSLSPEQIQKAQKYCKWASSALNYDDIPTAVTNLEKALHLLKTGRDS
ncbi:hypothetical protein B566_EDAN014316 [Ephemera danica]|nr:hypothetical protein B566_EDAN014316 [Ephemera danica]